MYEFLSPRELARALGVSESSLKRWADEGRIAAARTAGGHRRIPVAEAVRFIRAVGAGLRDPGALGLPLAALPVPSAGLGAEPAVGERLFELLRRDEADAAHGLIVSLYVKGWPLASIFDGPIRAALTRLGELWHHDAAGVFIEHRATQTCLRAIGELRRVLVRPPPDAPVALGCAPAGDPYLIPSLMASVVAADAGYRERDLGPETPLGALRSAVLHYRPALVWVALSVAPPNPRGFVDALLEVVHAEPAAPRGSGPPRASCGLVVGGRGAAGLRLPDTAGVVRAATMAELAAYARGRLVPVASGHSAAPDAPSR